MPFLFALYRAITISLDFRQATFLWLPDLSAGDPHHILEILMASTMIVLQLITPAPSADPFAAQDDGSRNAHLHVICSLGAPSGLLLYWLVGNIVGFSQQFLINKLTKLRTTRRPRRQQSSQRKRAGSQTAAGLIRIGREFLKLCQMLVPTPQTSLSRYSREPD